MSSVVLASWVLLWLRGSRTPVVMVERMADTSVGAAAWLGCGPCGPLHRPHGGIIGDDRGEAGFPPATRGFSDLAATRADPAPSSVRPRGGPSRRRSGVRAPGPATTARSRGRAAGSP